MTNSQRSLVRSVLPGVQDFLMRHPVASSYVLILVLAWSVVLGTR